MSRSSIFDLIVGEPNLPRVIEFRKTLDDSKPVAVKARPFRTGDFMVLGGTVPMPSGRKYDEWTSDEKIEYYNYLRKVVPHVIVEARHVAKVTKSMSLNPETAEAISGATEFIETWIPCHVVDAPQADHSRGEITINELEDIGGSGALYAIGNVVLFDIDQGGEIETLPKDVQSPEFRVESASAGDAGVDGGTLREDAARVVAEQA